MRAKPNELPQTNNKKNSPLPFLRTSSGPIGMIVHSENMNMCTYLSYR